MRYVESSSYRIGRPVLLFGALGNLLLALVKISIGFLAHSAALLADGVHSAVDVGALVATWVGFFVSRQPADAAHPYGHQKAESVAQKIVAILLILAGFEVFLTALGDLFRRHLMPPLGIALWVALVTVALKVVLLLVTERQAKALRSPALGAAAVDHRTDVLSGVAALIGIAASRLGFPLGDPLAAIGVSAVVVWTGWRLVVEAVDHLMDRFDDREFLEAVVATVRTVPGVVDVAGLRGRPMGQDALLDIEILVDGDLSVREGHDIARRVRLELERRHPRIKGVHVHVNPAGEEAAMARTKYGGGG